MKTLYETARDSLIVIESIASGSTTTNSLPHLARLAREGLTAIESADRAQQGEPVDVCAQMRALCSSCGGTGSVHRPDGEYMGECDCAATKAAEPADAPELAKLRAALKPFADAYSPEAERIARFYTPDDLAKYGEAFDRNTVTPAVTMGDFRRAYEACRAAPAPDTGIPNAGEDEEA